VTKPVFTAAGARRPEALDALLTTIITRVTRTLVHAGVRVVEDEQPYLDLAIASPYEQLAGASGARNCAVACEVNERAKLERVCRYMARGPISQERLRVLAIDLSRCSHFGGGLQVIAAISDPGVIARLLEPVGLEGRVQPGAPLSPVTN
jgi:hypothetical protein